MRYIPDMTDKYKDKDKDRDRVFTRMMLTESGLQVRENPDGEAPGRTITGYAILFNTPSAPLYADDTEEVREMIAPGAVTRELLDSSDIKMTMFHDRQLILARSRNGAGTLRYTVDERGVAFEFEAPDTVDGDKALELVRRGDVSGCSFMFRTRYHDGAYVSRTARSSDGGKTDVLYTVKGITGIYDFTLAVDPAYPDTVCEADARELFRHPREETGPDAVKMREQIREMRLTASRPL